MKVLILGSANSRNAAGIFKTGQLLGQNLFKNFGVEVHYLMPKDECSEEDSNYYDPLPVNNYKVIGPNKIGYSSDMYAKIIAIKPDIIHSQGLWMYLSYVSKKHYENTGIPYIISTHGMLDHWQLNQSFYKNLKKKIVLTLYERKHLKQASCIQALCKDEYDAIRQFGLKNPVAVIPIGIDLPLIKVRGTNYQLKHRWILKDERKALLFLSRIHPKKGLENLLQAWALTIPNKHNWQLVIAGDTTDKQYMQLLTDLTNKLRITDTVQFIGGQFGEEKQTCFINADAFILPSFSEGLPMAVLEAWSYSLPVIKTPYCNLPEGFDAKAAIRIEPEPENIAAGIQCLIDLNEEERRVMGENGYRLVKEKFTWQQVAQATKHLYEWIKGESDKPEFLIPY